jgi:3-oxoacyl-[acyl-carrier protein] reductase
VIRPRGRRDVVLVGSTGGVTPLPGLGIYAATKRGLRAAFDALCIELATSGVNVGIVMPGMFDTEGLTAEAAVVDGSAPETQIAPGTGLGPPAVLADTIAFMISLPEGTCINELVARPTGQINP